MAALGQELVVVVVVVAVVVVAVAAVVAVVVVAAVAVAVVVAVAAAAVVVVLHLVVAEVAVVTLQYFCLEYDCPSLAVDHQPVAVVVPNFADMEDIVDAFRQLVVDHLHD